MIWVLCERSCPYLKCGAQSQPQSSKSRAAPRAKWVTTTWQGHEFLDLARNDTNWHKAKSWILDKGQALTLEAMKAVLPAVLNQSLGL